MSLIPRKSRSLSPFDDLFGYDPDRFFEGFFLPLRSGGESGDLTPRIDIQDQEGAYLVKADLPGLKKEDIDVSLHDGLLTITAEKEDDHKEESEGKLVRRERYYGKYARQIPVGRNINEAEVQASFDDGVLNIKIPKLEQEQTRQISVDIK